MAKLRLKKMPPKPKLSASAATLKRYLERVSEVKKENTRRNSENKLQERLKKQVQAITPNSVKPSSGGGGTGVRRRKKSTTTKKKGRATSRRRRR